MCIGGPCRCGGSVPFSSSQTSPPRWIRLSASRSPVCRFSRTRLTRGRIPHRLRSWLFAGLVSTFVVPVDERRRSVHHHPEQLGERHVWRGTSNAAQSASDTDRARIIDTSPLYHPNSNGARTLAHRAAVDHE